MDTTSTALVALADDGELRASTYIIAQGMGYQHATVIKLLRRHRLTLEEFGRVGFEIQPFQTAGGQQQREIAMLNEQQSTLLITFMRNTKSVEAFKVALVREFFRMRDALHNRELTLWERRLRNETRDATSLGKARVGSRLMLDRKKEIPDIKAERQRIAIEQEPPLFMN